MNGLVASILPERGILCVSGPQARPFLQGLVTNNVEHVSPERAVYAALLTPQGKFLFDFIIADGGNASLLLDCDGARAAELAKRLNFYKLRAEVTIENLSADRSVIAFWGAEHALPVIAGSIVYTDPRPGSPGSRMIVPTAQAQDIIARTGAAPATPEDYHRRRIALGIGDAARDFEPDRTFPLEANLDDLNGIDFKKGCFVGQEVTSRTKRRGSVRKRLLPCLVEGAMPPRGTPVMADGREIGTVFSGDAATGRALALLRLDLIHGAPVEAGEARLTPQQPDWASFTLETPAESESDES